MSKKILIFIALIFSQYAFSQEVLNKISTDLKLCQGSFQIVNDSTKITTIFTIDKKKVNIMRLDHTMHLIDSLSGSSERPDKDYNPVGYISNNSTQMLFWTSNNSKKINCQTFNLDKKAISNKLFSLNLKDERVVETFSLNNKFYMLTVIEKTDILKFYEFNKNNEVTEKTIDLNGFKFYSFNYTKTTLYSILKESFSTFEQPFSIQKISTDIPTPLSCSAKKRKYYFKDNHMVLTLDNNMDYTQIININLDNYTATEKIIKTPYLMFDGVHKPVSNSFLIDNKLYQIKIGKEQLILNIKDIDGKLITENTINQDKPIDFKNSEVVQYGSQFDNSKRVVLEKSEQFLRKMNLFNPGISCYNLNGKNIITLGCVSVEFNDKNTIITSSVITGGLLGGLIAAAITSGMKTPSYDNFDPYKDRIAIYFESQFDENYKHLLGEIKPTVYDKIKAFKNKNEDIKLASVFKLDGDYYFNYYDVREKKYSIVKFKD